MRLSALLAAAFTVRAFLVIQGGQYYWPDERLYRVSQSAAECLIQGDVSCAARTLMRPEHTLFMMLGVIPGVIEQYLGANARIPALFFATFSLVSIWIVAKIARSLGADEREAWLAAALLAWSATWTYYSRHLLPYDVAMTFALLGLLIAVQTRSDVARAWLCGAACSAAFLSYSGSWPLVGFVLLTPALFERRGWHQTVINTAHVVCAFVIPVLALFSASALAGQPLLHDYVAFAGTVTQGSFAEGWSLPFAYLWHAEHAMLLLWLACFVLAGISMHRATLRSQVAVAGVLFVYASLVVMSVVAGVFVVYGRTARALVPLLCLLTAEQVHRFTTNHRRLQLHVIFLPVIVLQALINLRVPLTQVFPDRFKQSASAASTSRETFFVYADHIYPVPEPVNADAVVLAEARHPCNICRTSTKALPRISDAHFERSTFACDFSRDEPGSHPSAHVALV